MKTCTECTQFTLRSLQSGLLQGPDLIPCVRTACVGEQERFHPSLRVTAHAHEEICVTKREMKVLVAIMPGGDLLCSSWVDLGSHLGPLRCLLPRMLLREWVVGVESGGKESLPPPPVLCLAGLHAGGTVGGPFAQDQGRSLVY